MRKIIIELNNGVIEFYNEDFIDFEFKHNDGKVIQGQLEFDKINSFTEIVDFIEKSMDRRSNQINKHILEKLEEYDV